MPSLRLACAFVLGLAAMSAVPASIAAQQSDSARAGVRTRTDTTRRPLPPARTRQTARADSLAAPVSPGRAFLLSLALPGLGQSRLNRSTAGAVYFAAEGVALTMLSKSVNDVRIAKARVNDIIVIRYKVDPVTGAPVVACDTCSVLQFEPDSVLASRYAQATGDAEQLRSKLKARRLHLEDWIATLIFIHLFSGADAFVSSQLWDLPAQIELRMLPRGVGVGASLRFR